MFGRQLNYLFVHLNAYETWKSNMQIYRNVIDWRFKSIQLYSENWNREFRF